MSSTWYQDFLENGFAVIPKVISESKAAQYQQAASEWLKSFDNPALDLSDTGEPSIRVKHQHFQSLRRRARAVHVGHTTRAEHNRRICPTLANRRAPRLFRRIEHHPHLAVQAMSRERLGRTSTNRPSEQAANASKAS